MNLTTLKRRMTEKDVEDTKGIFKVISRKQACNSRQKKKGRMKKDKKTNINLQTLHRILTTEQHEPN